MLSDGTIMLLENSPKIVMNEGMLRQLMNQFESMMREHYHLPQLQNMSYIQANASAPKVATNSSHSFDRNVNWNNYASQPPSINHNVLQYQPGGQHILDYHSSDVSSVSHQKSQRENGVESGHKQRKDHKNKKHEKHYTSKKHEKHHQKKKYEHHHKNHKYSDDSDEGSDSVNS